MEWVEVTGRTVEEAKDRALDRLGVDERDAEFEVIEEPRPGFFGRLKGEARVRARVKPAQRTKVDAGDRRRNRRRRGGRDDEGAPGGRPQKSAAPRSTPAKPAPAPAASVAVADAGGDSDVPTAGDSPTRGRPRRRRSGAPRAEGERAGDEPTQKGDPVTLERQVQITEAFVRGLVDAFELQGEVSTTIDEDDAEVRIDGGELGLLIGPKGRTLAAISEISRAVVLRQLDSAPEGRVHIDVSGYRQRRREALERFARSVANEVIATGRAKALEPMSAADRKIVHDAVSDLAGVRTSSEGEEPARRVVISPA